MGTWNTSITGNDTAKDLYSEYTAAFYKFGVEEALQRIDSYIRSEMFDESDEEEWCNYVYSLADFLWKKGILPESVKSKAIEMIDSGFGLEIWAEEGEKVLNSRKQKLVEFKEKLLSPQPPKKKIKPNVHMERIFSDGDIVAVQLQTAGKSYTMDVVKPMTEEEFQNLDGKYILMQLVGCRADWSSYIVPEVKDYWAMFRLFDGIYDAIPEEIDPESLKEALLLQGGGRMSSVFTCESNLFYFKRRNYKVLCNRKDLLRDLNTRSEIHVFWSINKPWSNPDSDLVSAMGNVVVCREFTGSHDQIAEICRLANRYGRFAYTMTQEENEARYLSEERLIAERIRNVLSNGGKIYTIAFSRELGIVTVENDRIDNLYIEGRYQKNGFGTRLLDYAFSVAGKNAYIDVPKSFPHLLRVCVKMGLIQIAETETTVRMCKA